MPTHTSTRRRSYAQSEFLSGFLDERIRFSAAEIKLGLSKLRPEIARRIKGPPSADSQSFLASAVRTLGSIRSGANIELRIQCLFDCAIYSYNNGDTAGFLATIQLLDHL